MDVDGLRASLRPAQRSQFGHDLALLDQLKLKCEKVVLSALGDATESNAVTLALKADLRLAPLFNAVDTLVWEVVERAGIVDETIGDFVRTQVELGVPPTFSGLPHEAQIYIRALMLLGERGQTAHGHVEAEAEFEADDTCAALIRVLVVVSLAELDVREDVAVELARRLWFHLTDRARPDEETELENLYLAAASDLAALDDTSVSLSELRGELNAGE